MNYKKLGLRCVLIIVLSTLVAGTFIPAMADSCFHSVYGFVYINDVLASENTEVKLEFFGEPEEILDLTDINGYYQIDFSGHDWDEGFFFVHFEGEWFIPYDNVSIEIVPDEIGYKIDIHISTFGSPPYMPTDPKPKNNSVDVPLNPTLSVFVSDPDEDIMDVFFYDATDDGLIGIDHNVNSGDTASVQWKGLASNTKYYWYTVANDSIYETKSDVWMFTTVFNSPPDKPINPTPADGAEGVIIDPELSVFVTDPDGDLIDVTFFDASNDSKIGTVLDVFSGGIAKVVWDGLNYNMTYSWYAKASDGIYETRSDTWSFTTKEDNTPPEVEIIKPRKGLYIFDRFILPRFIRPALIIGRITIEANATDDDSGIERVEFYINGKLKANDTTQPYTYLWKWNRPRLFHIFLIKVVAYDFAGETATDKIIVRKFL